MMCNFLETRWKNRITKNLVKYFYSNNGSKEQVKLRGTKCRCSDKGKIQKNYMKETGGRDGATYM